MAYIPNEWKDQVVQRPKTYQMNNNDDGSVTLIDSFGLVTELGTPVNQDYMNHIEQGIAGCAIRYYSTTETFKDKEAVLNVNEEGDIELWQSLADNNLGNPLTDETKWQKVDLGGGSTGTGLQLFDLVTKDHVLSFEESKGFAQLGTYVYKEAVLGSRYGYPDFYTKCIEEKEAGTAQSLFMSINVDTVGSLTNNNGVLSGFSSSNYALTDVVLPSSITSYEFVAKFTTGSDITTQQGILANSKTNYATPQIIVARDNTFSFNHPVNSTTWVTVDGLTPQANTTYWVKATWDGTTFSGYYKTSEEAEYTLLGTDSATTIYWVEQIGIGIDTTTYPFSGSIDLKESYININGSRWWSGANCLNINKNSNGHIFYDIADKAIVDAYYEEKGVAWFYGVDTTNERIFLPRGKNYLAFTQNNIPVVGNGLSLGLMDGKGNNAGLAQVQVGGNMTEPIRDAYGVEVGTNPGTTIAFSPNVAYGVTDDAEKSGLIANTEDLFSNNPEAYIYMVVGNTEVESAATDIVDITTSENDTIPLFAPWYFDFEPNSTAWLIAGGQKNNGGLYASTYATLVQELTNPKYNLKVIDVDDMIADTDYSLYWKVDQTAQTFTAPTRVSYAALSGKIRGNGMTLGLFNGSDNFGLANTTYTPRLYPSSNTYGTDVGTSPSGSEGNMVSFGITTDPDKSGIEVERVTSQLYFKVCNSVQNLQVINVGEITTALADKIGKTDCPAYITDTYLNRTSWYRLYSDGWCEQGGRLTTGEGSVTLIKEFENTDYYVSIEQLIDATGAQYLNASKVRVLSTDSFTYYINASNGFWEAKGYISQGE